MNNDIIKILNIIDEDIEILDTVISNFEYTRNRILWATRRNPSILGVPKILPKTNKNKRK